MKEKDGSIFDDLNKNTLSSELNDTLKELTSEKVQKRLKDKT